MSNSSRLGKLLRPMIEQGSWIPKPLVSYSQYIDLSNIHVSANVRRQAPSVLGGLQMTIIVSMEADLAIGFLCADMGVL